MDSLKTIAGMMNTALEFAILFLPKPGRNRRRARRKTRRANRLTRRGRRPGFAADLLDEAKQLRADARELASEVPALPPTR